MSNVFGFISEDTFVEKMDTLIATMMGLVGASGGTVKPTSYSNIQSLVRAGLGSKIFAVSDQIAVSRGEKTLLFDVLGNNVDEPADPQFKYSLTVGIHDCWDAAQFSASQAFYYCAEVLPAGSYYFTLLAGYDTAYGGGKTFCFTLTKEVPAGGQLTFPWAWNTQAVTTKVSSYASSTSTTAIETVPVTEGATGTNLGVLDGKTENVNHTHRVRYGSNNYKESAIRQLVNSDKAAGSVWVPQTKFDRPPAWNTSLAGFLNGMDPEFLSVVGKTKKVVPRNTVTDGGGFDTVEDKFFLLSRRELFMGNEVSSINDGEPYPYFKDYSVSTSPNTGNDPNRVKYLNGSPKWYWTRTPGVGGGGGVRLGGPEGQLGYNSAGSTYGVVVACNIY